MPIDTHTGTGDGPAARTGRLQSPDLYDAITGERTQTSRARRGRSRRVGSRHHGSTSSGERRVPRITRTPGPRRRATAWALLAALAALLVFAAGIATGRSSTGSQTAPASPAPAGSQPAPDAGGDARGKAGAVAAAAKALLAVNSRDYISDPSARVDLLRAYATSEDIAALSGPLSKAVSPSAGDPVAAAFAAPGSSLWVLTPVGYDTSDCDASACAVRIWSVHVSASTGNPPAPATARWSTTTIPMGWQGTRGWRARFSAATTTPGPTPAMPPATEGAPDSDLDLVAAGHDFTPFAVPPGAQREGR
jgi:hypothetical protein